MKILVPFKRVGEPASTENGAPSASAKWGINPFDEIALEEAVRLRERGEASEVVSVTIAPVAAEEQIRSVLAMGVDRAIRVDDDRPHDSLFVAAILRAVVGRENPTLVLLGKQAVDDDSNQTGQMLAGLLGWPQATFVSKVVAIPGASALRCTRETDRGEEVIEVLLPAVVTADLRLNEPRYVSLPGLMKARRRPIETLNLAQLGATARARTRVLSRMPVAPRTVERHLVSVNELAAVLRDRENQKLEQS